MVAPTILITGCTDGIGLELLRFYLQRPCRPLGVGRRPYRETPLVSELDEASYCRVDLSLPDADSRLLHWLSEREIGRIDLLIHNAAGGFFGMIEDQSEEGIERLLRVNLQAPIAITHRLLPLLFRVDPASGWRGKVLFVGSVAAFLPCPDYAVYGASKAALDELARNLRIELHDGCDVGIVHPGGTRTGIFRKSGLDVERLKSVWLAEPERVAQVIARAAEHRRWRQVIGMGNRLVVFSVRHSPSLSRMVSMLRRAVIRLRIKAPNILKSRGIAASNRKPKDSPHCLITGGAAGIGAALTGELATHGYRLLLADRDATLLERQAELLSETTDIDTIPVDLLVSSDRKRLIAALREAGGTDCLILNAGISAVGRFERLPLEAIDRVLTVNLLAPILLVSGALREGLIRRGGTIVFLSSLAVYTGYPGASVYAASKRAIASLSESLRVALRSRNINTLCLFPGPTNTDHARRYSPDNRHMERRMSPERLARAAVGAIERRSTSLIPGMMARCFAIAGHYAPQITESVMKRAILDRLDDPLL